MPPGQPEPSTLGLRIPIEEAARSLADRIEKGQALRARSLKPDEEPEDVQSAFYSWTEYNSQLLKHLFTTSDIAEEYDIGVSIGTFEDEIEALRGQIGERIRKLESIRDRLELIPSVAEAAQRVESPSVIEALLRRFDRLVRQLQRRHGSRASFQVEDEYDLQDLLHAILRGIADDVRAEEPSPSYAGGSSRMDFLLKNERLVVETKLASPSLRDKQIGEQLVVDIKRYATHPDVERLFCLVYDPNGQVRNPQGLEADLSGRQGHIEVKVFIVPR